MNLLSTWAGLVDRMVTGRVRQVLQGTTLPPLHSWWDPPGEATICPNGTWSCPVTNSNRNCQEYVTAVEGGRGVKKRSTLQLCSEWVMWLACDLHVTCHEAHQLQTWRCESRGLEQAVWSASEGQSCSTGCLVHRLMSLHAGSCQPHRNDPQTPPLLLQAKLEPTVHTLSIVEYPYSSV